MSKLDIYALRGNGEFHPYGEARNAMAGALLIWEKLNAQYGVGGGDLLTLGRYDELWETARPKGRMAYEDKLLVASTFDVVWIAPAQIRQVARAWESFFFRYVYGGRADVTTGVVAQILYRAAEDADVHGIAFRMTSIVSSRWEVYDPETDESRPYNIHQDEGHKEILEFVGPPPSSLDLKLKRPTPLPHLRSPS